MAPADDDAECVALFRPVHLHAGISGELSFCFALARSVGMLDGDARSFPVILSRSAALSFASAVEYARSCPHERVEIVEWSRMAGMLSARSGRDEARCSAGGRASPDVENKIQDFPMITCYVALFR